MIPHYSYKSLAELGWAVLTALGIVIAQTMLTLQPEQVQDWRVWAVALLGAMVRAAGGALLAWFGQGKFSGGGGA